MKRYSICPFCFERINLHKVDFRCANAPGRCSPENDVVLANFLGVSSHITNKVVKIPLATTVWEKLKAWLWAPREVICGVCHEKTSLRLCPRCHSELPYTIGEYQDLIFAVIGAKEAGKSHYISVLIEKVRNEIGAHFECSLQPLNDETIRRYREDFYNPVFRKKEVIQATLSARADSRVRVPLIYTLSFKKKRKIRDVVTIVFFDTAGEDLDSEDTLRTENKYIYNSSGIILLLDPLQLPAVRVELPANTPLPGENSETEYLLERVAKLIRMAHGKRPTYLIKIPLAVAFSKMDALEPLLEGSSLNYPSQHDGIFDLNEFESVNGEMESRMREWAGSLIQSLEHNFKSHAFFGFTALGCNPHGSQKIDKLRPRRVEEPFLWLLWKHKLIGDQTFLSQLLLKLRPFKISVFMLGVVFGLVISVLLVGIGEVLLSPTYVYEKTDELPVRLVPDDSVPRRFPVTGAEKQPSTLPSVPIEPPKGVVKAVPSLQSPVEFVRAYYADINGGDVESAIRKWKSPNEVQLRTLIEESQWVKINRVTLLTRERSDSVEVSVEVSGKQKSQRTQQKWAGTLVLEKVAGEWKIFEMQLSEVLPISPSPARKLIMTGAGVGLRKEPRSARQGNVVTQLQIGSVVSPLEKITKKGEAWYKITTSGGQEGWVHSKYTMPLDSNNQEQAYVDVAKRKLSSQADFGTLVELCNFLNRVSQQVSAPARAAELKSLYLAALQRSLEQIPRDQHDKPRYSNWLKRQRAKIEYNESTGGWVVKK
ncbi:MAG: hypothetical protein DRR08_19380 [Candidatus Parabeggiatoa sp. nov. 2]|nr:MAG: hypothetical protein B6247_12990 [Beggiatoa sp. 4572_84]RKZ57309.1 MAG: hypothetical protein DRR08_19380 [Gammaproteobacteria bacterium]HEC84714.1 SH3 domain-containing protein [Thioploca sp.]